MVNLAMVILSIEVMGQVKWDSTSPPSTLDQVFLFLKFHLEVFTTSSSQIQVKSKLGGIILMVN